MRQHFGRKKLCKLNLLDVSYEEMTNEYFELSKLVVRVYAQKQENIALKPSFGSKKVYLIPHLKHVFAKNKIETKEKIKKPDLLNRVYLCKKCKKPFKYQSSCSRHFSKCTDGMTSGLTDGTTCMLTDGLTNEVTDELTSSNPTSYICNFGEEKTNYLIDKILHEVFMTPEIAIQRICKEVHFNKKYSNNQNIRLTNKTGKYINIYINDKWCTISIDKVYDKIINYSMFILNDFLKRNSHKLTYTDRQNFETFKIGIKHNKKIIKNIKISLKELFINGEIINLI
tara:strand:- start:17378 stop:18229 length:852 start_codon:yes stop_codon:yes gene_type:complete